MLEAMSALGALNLERCKGLKGSWVLDYPNLEVRYLSRINLRGCENMSREAILYLRKRFPSLKQVFVDDEETAKLLQGQGIKTE